MYACETLVVSYMLRHVKGAIIMVSTQ